VRGPRRRRGRASGQTSISYARESKANELLTQYLRRTFASVAADTPEVSWLALKLLLNHTTRADVTAGYVQVSTEQLRAAVQRVADKMLALCDVQHIAEGNVARLR
jgi:hypothetical protein